MQGQEKADPARLAKARPLLEMAGRIFHQQPLERQEIQAALRQLDLLLQTPKDEMKPSREEYLGVVGDAGRACATWRRRRDRPSARHVTRAVGFVRNGQTGAFDLVTGGAGR
ncbi:MAG TPA: hypothetical protein VM186_04495 [Planctomycetota bacterium]|nr:hypothetical protein [Planctomycetota bacterium]